MSKKKKTRAQEKSQPQKTSSIKSNSPADSGVTYRLKPGIVRAGALIIVALLLLLLFVFVFINRAGQNNNGTDTTTAENSSSDNNSSSENNGSDNTSTDNHDGNSEDGSTDGEGVSTGPESDVAESARIKSESTSRNIDDTGRWQATDYEKGEITTGKFEVKKGDTLWEIAEATYGSGFEWKKILEANKGSVGYLPNGSQALIQPGQTLILPK